jgi:hypothetical protein
MRACLALSLVCCACVAALPACRGGAPTDAQAGPEPLLPAIERAFSAVDATERARGFDAPALAAWQRLQGDATHRFLSVSDLRPGPGGTDAAAATIDFDREGWPMAVALTLRHTDTGWRIATVDADGALERRLAALGPNGLPRAGAARTWAGGLAGRDAAGRPTAAILVLATPAGLEVDGGPPLAPTPQAISEALRAAVARREALATSAHATARIQAAFALPRDTPADLLPRLSEWARAAGIREHLLVVRGADGGPSVLALPAVERTPSPPAPPPGPGCAPASAAPGSTPAGPPPLTCTPAFAPYLVLRATPEGQRLEAAGEAVLLGDLVDASVPEHLGPALSRLRAAHPGLLGLRMLTGTDVSHGQVVGLLDAARIAAPDLAVLPEPEEATP